MKLTVLVYRVNQKLQATLLLSVHGQLISGDNRKISVMMGTLLHVSGSCERHSELTEEM